MNVPRTALTARPSYMAPFWVALRRAERRMLCEALEVSDGARILAAQLLGIPLKTFRKRARYLGGVLPDEPVQEPPGSFPLKRLRLKREGVADVAESDDDDDDDDEEDEDEGSPAVAKTAEVVDPIPDGVISNHPPTAVILTATPEETT